MSEAAYYHRARHSAYSRAVAVAVRRGHCYCDADHLCGVHAAAFHAAHSQAVAGTRPWPGSIAALIAQVRAEVEVPTVTVRTAPVPPDVAEAHAAERRLFATPRSV